MSTVIQIHNVVISPQLFPVKMHNLLCDTSDHIAWAKQDNFIVIYIENIIYQIARVKPCKAWTSQQATLNENSYL